MLTVLKWLGLAGVNIAAIIYVTRPPTVEGIADAQTAKNFVIACGVVWVVSGLLDMVKKPVKQNEGSST